MQRLALGLALLCAGVLVAPVQAQEDSGPRVLDLMSEQEFVAAGLDRLTAQELAALDAWFSRILVQLLLPEKAAWNPRPERMVSMDFASLEGCVIVAEDGEFLGKITINPIDAKSITNEVGRYGSPVSGTSIFNEVGRYGGEVARMSPFNPVSSTPPRIFRGDEFVAWLTVNPIKMPGIDPRALVGWLKANE